MAEPAVFLSQPQSPGPDRSRMTTALLLAVAAGMLAVQLLFLPLPGIQQDEAVFVIPYLSGVPIHYSIQMGDVRLPVMSLEYVGMTKSWLYWPVFAIWEPGVWSMRLPVCFLSVLTVFLFAAAVRRATHGPLAVCAALLLATDATFILTNTFDWGPVALLLLATGGILFSLQRFAATGRKRFLAAAFFVAGAAVWHKALFLAVLAGMSVGLVLVFHREVRHHLLWKNFALASLAFCLGAAPLIAFNINAPLATFRSAERLPPTPFSEKLMMLRNTLNGRALEHYMIRSVPGEQIPLTGAPLEELVETWYRATSLFPGSLLLGGMVLSLLAFPFLGGSRLFPLLLFGWVALGVTVGLMLAFRSAGGGPHHTVLLFPAPHFLVAATGFALAERSGFRKQMLLAVAGCVLVAGSNLLLLAQYHSAARSNGFSVYWTDALENLAEEASGAALPVVVLDWGIELPLRIATSDRIHILPDATPREEVLYISHCDGYVIDESRSAEFWRRLEASGLSPLHQRSLADLHGEAVFCVFQLTSRLEEARLAP